MGQRRRVAVSHTQKPALAQVQKRLPTWKGEAERLQKEVLPAGATLWTYLRIRHACTTAEVCPDERFTAVMKRKREKEENGVDESENRARKESHRATTLNAYTQW
jgi:hypothetical protein